MAHYRRFFVKVNSYYKLNVHFYVGYSTYTHAHEHTQVASGGRGGIAVNIFLILKYEKNEL